MKKLKILFLLTLMLTITSIAEAQKATGWPKAVTTIDSKGGETVTVDGDLASGSLMTDLSWAWNSSNACFPGTQAQKFQGNHVFFATTMPARSIMKISVTPDDANANLSIYAYRIGATEYSLVPNLPSSVTCEADHKWDRPWKGKVQNHERKTEFQNPSATTYNILIGVSAPKGTTTGKFKVAVATEM